MKHKNGLLSLSILFLMLVPMTGCQKASRMNDLDVISTEDLRRHVEQIPPDRNPHEGYFRLEQAARYIQEELLKMGWEVQEDHFEWGGRSYQNIIAEKRGITLPHEILILGAHYDTAPGTPGADDNGSAVAVLLETARQIQPVSFHRTIRLIAFSLEEVDYAGSTHYVSHLNKDKEKILGMISLEMVGFIGPRQDYPVYLNPKFYPPVGDFIAIVGNGNSQELLKRVCQSFKTNVPELPLESFAVLGKGEGMEEMRLSDHASFWKQGIPALMMTDTGFLRNPNYHARTDRIETLDFEFMNKVAMGTCSAIVELAGWIDTEDTAEHLR